MITFSFLHPLAGADLVPRQVVQVQAQLLCVCHAQGTSANIIIEVQYFASDIDNIYKARLQFELCE